MIVIVTVLRIAGVGKIVGGIFLLIFGLGAIAIGYYFFSIQSGNVAFCNTAIGSFSQLDAHNAEICSKAQPLMITFGILALIGLIMIIIGIILIAFGIKQRS
jgi:hypothetical protein